MSDECMVPKRWTEKNETLLAEINRCPHGDGAHWPGDAGDIIDSLAPRVVDEDGTSPYRISTLTWLRTLGAIQ